MGPVSVSASHQRAALRPAPSASTAPALPALRSPKLLDRLRERIRLLHYSRSTEQAYVYWCRSFIRFHNLRHPMDMGCPEVEAKVWGQVLQTSKSPTKIHPWHDPCGSNFPAGCTTSPRAATGAKPSFYAMLTGRTGSIY